MKLYPYVFLFVAGVLFILYRRYSNQQDVKAELRKSKKKDEPSYISLDHITAQPADWTWQQQEAIPYRPWHNGPYHITMGLKNTDIADWIELDKTYLDKYKLKRQLLERHRKEVTRILPGCEEEAFEALELLRDVLIRHYPSIFCLTKPDVIENKVTGDIWDLRRESDTWKAYHPLEVMSLLATDDFFLLTTDDNGLTTLRAGVICFPAGWKISERIGHSLWQIHAGKVPQYETKLAKSMDRFFVKLPVGSPISRFNYAIDDSDELFHIHSHHNLTADQLEEPLKLERLHLRVERQFLQRLPRTRGLLFSIRTYITPITEVTRDLDVARALRTSVGSYTADVAKYKNKPLWDEVLRRHLDGVLGSEEGIGI